MNFQDFFSYSGWLFGVAGIILSIWFYIKQKAEKEPQCYYKNFQNIVKLSNEDKLKIVYDSTEVDRVSTSYIFIWNKGRKPIRKEDIPAPLMLTLDNKYDLLLLEYKVIKTSKKLINFSVHQCNKRVLEIHFDYLDKNDGAVIEVKHTGDTDTKPEIIGAILEVSEGVKTKEIKAKSLQRSKNIFSSKVSNTLLITVASVVFIAFTSIGYYFAEFMSTNKSMGLQEAIILIIAPIIIALIGSILGVTVTAIRERPPYPKSLDIDVDIKPY